MSCGSRRDHPENQKGPVASVTISASVVCQIGVPSAFCRPEKCEPTHRAASQQSGQLEFSCGSATTDFRGPRIVRFRQFRTPTSQQTSHEGGYSGLSGQLIELKLQTGVTAEEDLLVSDRTTKSLSRRTSDSHDGKADSSPNSWSWKARLQTSRLRNSNRGRCPSSAPLGAVMKPKRF